MDRKRLFSLVLLTLFAMSSVLAQPHSGLSIILHVPRPKTSELQFAFPEITNRARIVISEFKNI